MSTYVDLVQVSSADDIAAAIREERLRLGLTQADVASRARVSRAWLNGLERGRPRAEVALVLRVLGVLGLTVSVVPASTSATVDLDAVIDRLRR